MKIVVDGGIFIDVFVDIIFKLLNMTRFLFFGTVAVFEYRLVGVARQMEVVGVFFCKFKNDN